MDFGISNSRIDEIQTDKSEPLSWYTKFFLRTAGSFYDADVQPRMVSERTHRCSISENSTSLSEPSTSWIGLTAVMIRVYRDLAWTTIMRWGAQALDQSDLGFPIFR